MNCTHLFQIKDPDTGKIMGAGEIGEICVKNSYQMKGYLKREDATADFFSSDGFSQTGDLGYYTVEETEEGVPTEGVR